MGKPANFGTAEQAIKFAVTIDDHFDRLEFLNGWLQGNLDPEEWDDYLATLSEAA